MKAAITPPIQGPITGTIAYPQSELPLPAMGRMACAILGPKSRAGLIANPFEQYLRDTTGSKKNKNSHPYGFSQKNIHCIISFDVRVRHSPSAYYLMDSGEPHRTNAGSPRLLCAYHQNTCSVRAMISSWMALSREVKKALYPATRTTIPW